MRTLALCAGPAVALVAFAAAFVRTFRPTCDTQGEQ